ncbi:MAG TPA: NAD-dependent deacylase [Anaerolineales bacterium]|nr:NAD-dependent deacylase [Anaerolineales bacterium]
MFADTDPLQVSIRKAAQMIRQARKAVSLTGAGYSTPSGIPDFRSTHSGLWEHHDPMEVASLSTFRFHPKKFFDWFRPLATQIHTALPNAAHFALAQLEKAGHFVSVVTQNIDGLHQRAGSERVFEVHGTLTRLVCTHCYTPFPATTYLESYIYEYIIPLCPHCQHVLKPDVVLFEEQLPFKTWRQAEEAVENCDLLLIAGSSLLVFPAASLPIRALEKGAPLIIINKTPTYLDEKAEVVIHGDLSEVIPRLALEVLSER